MSSTELLTTSAAADRLGVSPRTIARMVGRGELTPAAQAPGPRGAMFFHVGDIIDIQIRQATCQHAEQVAS